MVTEQQKNRAIAIWLLIGVGMIIIQTLIGGITRLSGSGLSITEWDIVTGTLPPLNYEQWLSEFEKYKQSPQFQYLNFDFTLSNFKAIYFWEWFHRLWARLMGFVFAIPFVYFIVKKYFKKDLVWPLVILFILGSLQGMVGWIMVQSGLVGDATYVRPTRLAVHFVLAMILACYIFWLALSLIIPNTSIMNHSKINYGLIVLFLLILFQFIFGALLAGHKAATAAPTWPTINGDWIPTGMGLDDAGHALINNKVTIHFIHRTTAYIIALLTVVYALKLYKITGLSKAQRKWILIPVILVFTQIILGIFTVLISPNIVKNQWGAFETLALLHQLTGMLLMLSVLFLIYITYGNKLKIKHIMQTMTPK